MTTWPNLSTLLDMLGTILTTSRHWTCSLQGSPTPYIKRSTNSTAHKLMHSGSIMPWNDNASGFMLKPALISLDLLLNLVQIGDLDPLPQLDASYMILTLWMPLPGESMLDLTPLIPISLHMAYLHPEDKDGATASISGK